MGNQNNSSKLTADSELQFHSIAYHLYHGQIPIYTTKAIPMSFLMKIQRQTSQSRLFHLFQHIQDQHCQSLITLYGFKIERDSDCSDCSDSPAEDSTLQYWQFLNYSLGHHIRERISRKMAFTQQQIWHTLQVVCEGWRVLWNCGLAWQVHPNNLLLMPEGKLKCEWSHLQMKNSHLRYYRLIYGDYLKNKINSSLASNEGFQFLSPQEQHILRTPSQNINVDLQKAAVYKVGLLLLYMTTFQLFLQPPQANHIHHILHELQRKKYPKAISQIILNSVLFDASKRWSIKQIQSFSKQYFNEEFQILLNDSRKQDIQQHYQQVQLGKTRKRNNRHFMSHYHQTSYLNQTVNFHQHRRSFDSPVFLRQTFGANKRAQKPQQGSFFHSKYQQS